MSLLKKASIITTPTAYAEDYLYSIKPAEYLGAELVTNGGFDTDSDWTKGAGWTITGGEANANNIGSSYLFQTISNLVIGKTYSVTYTITSYTTGDVVSGIGNLLGSRGTTRNAAGTYTDIITFDTNTSNKYFGVFANNNFTGKIDNISIKEFVNADFQFDRNSTGTRVNEDYLIEDVPYNFLTYSTDFTFWTQADTSTVQIEDSFDNSNNAYRVSIASGTGFQTIRKTGLNLSGQQTFSIYAKKDTLNFTRILFGGFGNFWVDLANGTQGTTTGSYDSITITNAGNGFFRIVATFTATSPVTHIYLYPSTANANVTQSSGSVIFQYAQLVKGDQPKDYLKTTDRLDIPRIDYTNGEPSILLEPSRTNEILHSNQFDTTWSTGFSTITGNSGISPSGINNAWKLQSTTVGAETRVRQSHTFSIGESVTISCFMKAGTVNFGIVRCYAISGGGRAWFNLSNGTVGTENSGITGSIQEYPNGWYRCVISFTTDQSGAIDIAPAPADNDYLANAIGENILIYGAQLETGSYATSLIHTSGSAVTRSADVANNAGNSDLFNDSEGVLYLESSALVNDDVNRFIQIHDGTYNNAITLYYSTTENQIIARTWASGSSIVSLNKTLEDATEFHKFAFSYKSGAYKFYIDGRQVATDTNSNTPTGLNQLGFLQGPSGNNFYANTKSVMVFKEALTDLELEKLTGYNNHELYMNYYNRLSYLGLAEEYNVESDINNYIL